MSIVLQHFVMPSDADADVLPLYAEGKRAFVAERPANDFAMRSLITPAGRENMGQVLSRFSYIIPQGHRTSFATYFNAFAASYWRQWTAIREVHLRMRVSGEGIVMVYRSDAHGVCHRVQSARFTSEKKLDFTLPVVSFYDGGWYWFDVESGQTDSVVEEATWEYEGDWHLGEDGQPHAPSLSTATTTFNRPADCVEVLRQIAGFEPLHDYLKHVRIVDQGNEKVEDDPGFPEVSEKLGDVLDIVDQGNIGGSGGFSRGMREAVKDGADFALLLDDDVRCEPEAIYRSVVFGALNEKPTIVGGHMFSMNQRTVLRAMAEVVNPGIFMWGNTPGTIYDLDIGAFGLREVQWMHRRFDSDYAGWWMCLIPTSVIRKIGLSLPLFIKWDDAEYGLRAREAGVPVVSMPGIAVWHVPWTAKDDSLDWQAYFHARNRVIAAILHPNRTDRKALVKEYLNLTLRYIFANQYSVAYLRIRALRDIFRGPQEIADTLSTIVPQVRKERSHFTDAQVHSELSDFPDFDGNFQQFDRLDEKTYTPRRDAVRGMLRAIRKQIEPTNTTALKRPRARMSLTASRWWRLAGEDSVLVSNSDGSGMSWYKRDRSMAFDLGQQAIVEAMHLYKNWEKLVRLYDAKRNVLVSFEAWDHIFEVTSPDKPSNSTPAASATQSNGNSSDNKVAGRLNGDSAHS